ncbi:GNAT family N-acetyltransferase (plasmid) [Tistrella mobilis]|uniref:GNAT family N-acetyltransferase n=1 Tax=Tistrella mobilis TaxID=171437 RepID=UPI003556BF2C
MAPTEPAPLTPHAPAPHALAPHALDDCRALSAEAGWNQTAADWMTFFRSGTVFGITEGGTPVATGAVIAHGPRVAWIGMVLVRGDRRGGGLGTQILKVCLDHCRARGLLPVLDATPAGERVYRPLGFLPWFGLTRWDGAGGGRAAGGMRNIGPADLPRIAEADAAALGAPRPALLAGLAASGAPALIAEAGSGFALGRPGRIATQIGPVVAEDESTAARLIEAAIAAVSGPVIIDLADHHAGLADLLRARGFTPRRPFLRMALAQATPLGTPAHLYAAAGPEFG